MLTADSRKIHAPTTGARPVHKGMPGSTRFQHITVEQCTFVRQVWGHEEAARVAASPFSVRVKPLQPPVSPETRAAVRRRNWPDSSMPLGSLTLVARPLELSTLGNCNDIASTSTARPRTSPGMQRPRSGPAFAGAAAALGQQMRLAHRGSARSPNFSPSISVASTSSRLAGRSLVSASPAISRGTPHGQGIEPRVA